MCNCEQNSKFNFKLREAKSKGFVVWQSANGELVNGEREKAELRLKNGTIECYFIPEISGGVLSFETVLKPVAESKSEKVAEYSKDPEPIIDNPRPPKNGRDKKNS